MKKRFFVIALIFILGLGGVYTPSADAATRNWSINTTAPGYGAIKMTSQGKVTYNYLTAATYDGYASINTVQGLGGYRVVTATISGKGVTSYYAPLYTESSTTFDSRSAYNVSVTSPKVIVSANMKGKSTLVGWPTSIRIYTYGYVKVADGYESSWNGYASIL